MSTAFERIAAKHRDGSPRPSRPPLAARSTRNTQSQPPLSRAMALSTGIQLKRAVGDPGDRAEDEADSIAGQLTTGAPVDMATSRPNEPYGSDPRPDEAGRRRPQPLSSTVQSDLADRMAFDLSGVRVHTDASASKAAESMGARAFTLGRHIAFASGEFRPEIPSSRRLLAHELAHVIQSQPAPSAILRRQPQVTPDAVSSAGFVTPPYLTDTRGPAKLDTPVTVEVPGPWLKDPEAPSRQGHRTAHLPDHSTPCGGLPVLRHPRQLGVRHPSGRSGQPPEAADPSEATFKHGSSHEPVPASIGLDDHRSAGAARHGAARSRPLDVNDAVHRRARRPQATCRTSRGRRRSRSAAPCTHRTARPI